MVSKMSLEQIFLYVTFNCNCQCITCYIRDHYSPVNEMPLKRAKEILSHYHSMGAYKLTLLGGEPTLYKHIFELIRYAKSMGYEYIRIQTNGQFPGEFLKNNLIRDNVDTFSYSIDGATEETNKIIRIGCKLDKTLSNMRLSKKIGYDVRVNITVTSMNINEIFDIFHLLTDIKPSMIYLNLVFPMGGAADKPNLSVNPHQWREVYENIRHKFNDDYDIRIKLPVGYANSLPEDHQCIATSLSRLYIMPNGDAYPCILFINNPDLSIDSNSSEYIAKISKLLGINVSNGSNFYCPILSEGANVGGFKPLCLYYRKIYGVRDMNNKTKLSGKSPQLGVVLTPICNLKCVYCRPGGEGYYENTGEVLTKKEIIEIIKLASEVGFTHVKFTGGEPLIRRDVFEIIDNTRKISSIKEIQLVTNGTLLKDKVRRLKDAGIDYLTISLDAVTPDIFKIIRGHDISPVIESLYECKDVGLPTRINMVVMKSNFSEIKPMIELTAEVNASLKLLDLIYMEGYSNYAFWKKEYLHFDKVRKLLFDLGAKFAGYEEAPGGIGAPLEIYRMPNGVSVLLKDSTRGTYYHKTCEDCKFFPCQDAVISVRVTHDGKLKRCLIRNDNLIPILPLIRAGRVEDAQKAIKDVFRIMVESKYYPKKWNPEVLIAQIEGRKDGK